MAFDFLKSDGNGGFEELSSETTSFPFLRIIQDMSPCLKKTKSEYIPDAEAGMFLNTGMNKVYSSPLNVVVGRFEHTYIEWKPNRGGFAGAWSVGDVQKAQAEGRVISDERRRLTTLEGNELQETFTYWLMLTDHKEDGVIILSLSGTQLKEARKWNRMLMSKTLPDGKPAQPYFCKWSVSSIPMHNEKGDWFGLKIDDAGFIDEETYNVVVSARQTLPSSRADMKNAIEAPRTLEITASENTSDTVPF